MDKEFIIECIENEIESGCFDFKKDIYDFTISKNKQDFLIDVLSFANSHFNCDKYIITGVKLYKDGHRDLFGITESKIKDGADYQSLINDNIEPNIIVDFDVVEYKKMKFGIFCIKKENNDKPYLLSKKYENLEKGFIKIRKGQKNEFVSRRDFDFFYKDKFSGETSDICLRGIVNKKVSNNFCAVKYNSNVDFKILKNKIDKLFSQIGSFKLIESYGGLVLGERVSFSLEETENIRRYANNNSISINKSFFNLGDLHYLNLGLSGNLIGSDTEKEKYFLIEDLEKYTGIYNGLDCFYSELFKLYYVDLAIENVGKKYDDEIDVTLKLKRSEFLEYKDFPVPLEFIIKKMLDDEVICKLFKIEKIAGVSDCNLTSNCVFPIFPTSMSIPGTLERMNPDYEDYVQYYKEYIHCLSGYEIISNDEYYFIKYEQKSIKPNEIIFLPSRLIFKNLPKYIEYEIKTKHNSKIMSGKLEIVEI